MFIGKMITTSWGFLKGTIVVYLGKARGQFPSATSITGKRFRTLHFYASSNRTFQSSAGPLRGVELGYWREL